MSALPTWNLVDLYPSVTSPTVKKDIKKCTSLAQAFEEKYKGTLKTLSGDALAQAVAEYEKIQEILGKLGSYAQLMYAQDMSKSASAQFYQNIQEQLTAASVHTLFFGLELNKLDEKNLASKLKSKSLRHYSSWLRDVRSFKPYQLSDEAEKMLHEKAVAGRAAWTRLFDETISDLRFPINGKELTSAEALDLLSRKDAPLRKKAAKSVGEILGKNIKTFALITNTLAKDKEIEDNWRGFNNPISSRNVSNMVEDEVVKALIDTVRKNYPKLSHRYYAIKAKSFGVKKLAYWDRNAPLPQDVDRTFTWSEAKELVLSSYAAFSPALAKIGKEFFDKNWIDVPTRPGKSPGAFAHPTVPSAHPYLLLNFQGKVRDVMTLAHELGHGVHQVLAGKQGALMCDTPLTLAETASVFGEQLTFQEILRREKDARKRKIIIAGKIEDMLNTVVRQIAFCDFETRVHAERKKGELTPDHIGKIWLDVQKESLGPAIQFEEEYRHYWAYIPHFIHSPFYVYAYAFGDCLVNSLYAVYQTESKKGKAKEFEKKYITMLEAGGTLRHQELLKPFGLDATRPDFWQKGLNILSDLIEELEK